VLWKRAGGVGKEDPASTVIVGQKAREVFSGMASWTSSREQSHLLSSKCVCLSVCLSVCVCVCVRARACVPSLSTLVTSINSNLNLNLIYNCNHCVIVTTPITASQHPHNPNHCFTVNRYPDNVTLRDMLFFIMVPTLCYEIEFPRTNRIRWRFAMRRFIEVVTLLITVIFLVSFLFERAEVFDFHSTESST
jgi:hypothetical protein